MASERWTSETRDLVASTIVLHDLDGDFGCEAGDLAPHEDCAHSDGETCTAADIAAWEAHRADMVLAALASKGLLDEPDDEPPASILAHDDRCDRPLGGPCNCAEWERFDLDRAASDDDLCDCSEGLCAGFDGSRDEADGDIGREAPGSDENGAETGPGSPWGGQGGADGSQEGRQAQGATGGRE